MTKYHNVDVRAEWVKLLKSCFNKICSVHPQNFNNLPIVSYTETGNNGKNNNLNDRNLENYNPIIYTAYEYTNTYWAKSIGEVVEMIDKFDDAIIDTGFIKTYTSPDMYDNGVYYKVVRYKAIIDNNGNVYNNV